MRKAWLAVGAVLVLAGCHDTPPPRRAGLWNETFTKDGKRDLGIYSSVHLCVGPQTDAHSPIFSFDAATKQAGARKCTAPSAGRRSDGLYTFSSTCPKAGGGTTRTDGLVSGNFHTAYHMQIASTTEGSTDTRSNGRHVVEIDGQWLGPCPAGLGPGDMILPNGLKLPQGRLVDPHRGPKPPGPAVPRPSVSK
ncbi:MAG: DUF3617 family protein [Caulobacteraceae bacterium]